MISAPLSGVSRVMCIGAHPDDIEIGAAGTLLRLASALPEASFQFVVMTGDDRRIAEAKSSAAALIPGRVEVETGGFRDGYLPYQDPAKAKEWLAELMSETPDLLFAPHLGDRHQDHRFAAELAWQLARRSTIFEYEIPKWEGERPNCNYLVALDADTLEAKVSHLSDSFPSQHGKGWYDPGLFEAMARIRGIEAGVVFAEGFTVRRLMWA